MRVLLKLSGEALSGEGKRGYDPVMMDHVLDEISDVVSRGTELGVVVGAGNLVRGRELEIGGIYADQIGMLGTVMNSIYLSRYLESRGIRSIVVSAIVDLPAVKRIDYDSIRRELEGGTVVVFAGGTSNPLFTTDTAAVLRAVEMGASRVLKATKVDGVYDRDPKIHPNARRFDRLTFEEAIELGLEVMDSEAFSLCKRLGIEVVVFDFFKPGNLWRAISGEVGTLIFP